MSKIHEALKRAREAKSQELSDPDQHAKPEQQAQPAPASLDHSAHPAIDEFQADQTTHGRLPGQYLRFDDLLKQCAEPRWQLDSKSIVFSESHHPGFGAEQFRTLRSRLYQMRDTSNMKRILVTSAIPGEGKTVVATNLAQAIALERDRKVLLIDGDLRDGKLHLPLGAPLSPGLSEFLHGEVGEAEIIQHGKEGNLCFIAAGSRTKNASELLSNGQLQKLLDRVAPLFDWVILDSPPCLPVSDASVLASFVDGVLLVVRAGSTPSALVQRAQKELRKGNVVGAILNAVKDDEAHGTYGYPAYGYPRKKSGEPSTSTPSDGEGALVNVS
jgi:protein-tyrosine kinase